MAKRLEEEFDWVGSSAHRDQRGAFERGIGAGEIVGFEQVLEHNTGAFMTPTTWAQQRERARKLEDQTEHLCDALEAEGITARLESGLTRINLVDGTTTAEKSYRNVCFLPCVAQKNRRDQLNDLGYYLENIDGRHWRYLVITFGDRIPAHGDLSGAITAANQRMAKWRERVLKELGVVVGFTGLEFPRDQDGTYHLHANVLVKTPFFFDGGQQFREMTFRHFGTWWKDNGQIEDLRELVKYPFKPNSIQGADSAEIAWLFRATFRRRITRLMGPIADFRRGRKDDGLRVFKMKNRHCLREVGEILPRDNALPDDPEDDDQDRETSSSGENILVARVTPNFRDTPWAAPSVLVWNYNPAPEERRLKSRRRLETLTGWRADAMAYWSAAGAPDPTVAREIAAAAVQASATGEQSNLRALWNREAAAGRAYMVHNETITSPSRDDDLDEFELNVIEDPDPPPDRVVSLFGTPAIEPPIAEIDINAPSGWLDMFEGVSC